MLIYAIVGVTALAGLINAPWWAGIAGACLLVLALSQGHHREPAYDQGGTVVTDVHRITSTIITSVCGAVLAYAAGRGSALLWGL
jgi:hypothetical protein